MRHFISLGIRGVLLELGGLLMRVQGGIFYRNMIRRRGIDKNRIVSGDLPNL